MAFQYTVYGIDASFFTAKLRAVLRYKGVPHTYVKKRPDVTKNVETRSGTQQIPVLQTPENWMIADTTPLAHLLDARFPTTAVLPPDPALRLCVMMLEDWVDEWLVRPAMYYRWQFPESVEMVTRSMGADLSPEGTDEKGQLQIGQMVAVWAARACRAIGAEKEHGPGIEKEFVAFLQGLNKHLNEHEFLFGARASLADLAIAGACKAHLYFEPVPKRLVDQHCPNFPAYLDRMWDGVCTGGEWFALEELTPFTRSLLEGLKDPFHRFLDVNRQAVEKEEKGFVMAVDGQEISFKARRYVEWTRTFTSEHYYQLPQDDHLRAQKALTALGLLQPYLEA